MVNNFDSMDENELWLFWKTTNSTRPIATARRLFADRPTGYVAATKQLGNYAANKATAIKCRLAGDIQAAIVYETICKQIYDFLPTFAKW
jgi:hypothetical protein